MKKLFVITPTYNEAGNIVKLIEAIKAETAILDAEVNLLVIDDNSPDGTATLVENLKAKNTDPKFVLHLLKRAGKLGLGTAYIEGFKYVLPLGADYIICMDADFSHDPKYLKNIYQELQTYDVVIGSRYVKGGGVLNWNLKRKMLSGLGNWYTRMVLGWGVHDATTGYVGYQRKVLEKMDLDKIKGVGYYFLIETKYKAYKNKFSIKETPIIFPDRINGKSKMSNGIIGEAFFSVLKLRFSRG